MSEHTIRINAADMPTVDETAASSEPGDLNDQLLAADFWTDEMVAAAGIPIVDSPLVTCGGGIGSFVLFDYLRIAGVPASHIKSLSVLDRPWQTYEYLTQVSQVPRGERLRSDSGSTPGNPWGFPSYAVREAFADKSIDPLWNVFSEPLIRDYYTPRAGMAFEDMQREADRTDYWSTQVKGQVRMTRRRVGGGYFTILTPPPGTSATKRVAYRSTYVHLALGYPGLRFLPDLQEYRQKYGDYQRVVNAYEPHEQVYTELNARPGVVVIRGGGIVASRVLQRLIDDREQHGAQTQILHLFRTYVTGNHGPSVFMRRKGGDGWAYQGFNWPKGTWGGQLKEKMERLEGKDRSDLLDIMGGTNTPIRKLWTRQLADGRKGGWYRTYVGTVQDVYPGQEGTVVTKIASENGSVLEIPANFVIDCTGLEADIREHRVFADLLDHGGAGRNPKGRLDVERTFELRGTRSEPGRMYASGSATLGGYYAGVDSFLGLQYAALRIADDLAAQGFASRIGVGRSVSQWFKWMRNQKI